MRLPPNLSCAAAILACATFGDGLLAGAPFTREVALEQARKVDPAAELPPDVPPEGVEAREDVVFADVDGAELRLDLYTPAGEGPHPTVLVVHGGGWEAGGRSMERPLAKRLAERGFLAVPVDYRLGPAGQFPAALHDLKTAVRWLRAHADELGLDKNHIGAIGGSAGGQLVALLGATNDLARFEGNGPWAEASSAVQAVVNLDGLADFTDPALLEQQRKSPSAPTRFLGGSFAERPQVWRDASPLTHLGLRCAPTLFVRSTAPTPLLPGREELSRRLRMVGIDSEVVTIEDSPHVFWLVQPWFELAFEESARFLRKHLMIDDPE